MSSYSRSPRERKQTIHSLLDTVENVYQALTGNEASQHRLSSAPQSTPAPATVTARARADVTVSLLEEIFHRRQGRVRPLLRLILSHLRAAVYRHAGKNMMEPQTLSTEDLLDSDGAATGRLRDAGADGTSLNGEAIAMCLAREILRVERATPARPGEHGGAVLEHSEGKRTDGDPEGKITPGIAAAGLKGATRAERLQVKKQVILALTRRLVQRRLHDEEEGRTDGSYISEVARLEKEKVDSRRRVRELEEGNSALARVMGRTRKLVDATAVRWQKTIRQHYFRYWKAFTARRRDQMRRIDAMVMRHGRAGRLRLAFDALRIGTRQLRAERAEREQKEREEEAARMESKRSGIAASTEKAQAASASLSDRIRGQQALSQQLRMQLDTLKAQVERQPANQLRAVARAWADASIRGIGRKLDRICSWLFGDLSGLRGAGKLDFHLPKQWSQPVGSGLRRGQRSGQGIGGAGSRDAPSGALGKHAPDQWPQYGKGVPGECDAFRPPED